MLKNNSIEGLSIFFAVMFLFTAALALPVETSAQSCAAGECSNEGPICQGCSRPAGNDDCAGGSCATPTYRAQRPVSTPVYYQQPRRGGFSGILNDLLDLNLGYTSVKYDNDVNTNIDNHSRFNYSVTNTDNSNRSVRNTTTYTNNSKSDNSIRITSDDDYILSYHYGGGGGGGNHGNLRVTCRVSDTHIDEGDRVTFTADVDGGDSPFDYDWRGAINGDDRVETFRFNNDGRYHVSVRVEDDNGDVYTDDCPTIVVDNDNNNNNDDLELTCRVSDTRIDEGDQVTYEADVDGGDSPYDYDWRGDISGDDRIERVRYHNEGRYEVSIRVEDDDGERVFVDCPDVIVDNDNNNNDINLITSTNSNPPGGNLASLNSVFLSQVPYTGARETLTVIGYAAAILIWSALIVFFLARRKRKNLVSGKIQDFKNSNKSAKFIA